MTIRTGLWYGKWNTGLLVLSNGEGTTEAYRMADSLDNGGTQHVAAELCATDRGLIRVDVGKEMMMVPWRRACDLLWQLRAALLAHPPSAAAALNVRSSTYADPTRVFQGANPGEGKPLLMFPPNPVYGRKLWLVCLEACVITWGLMSSLTLAWAIVNGRLP